MADSAVGRYVVEVCDAAWNPIGGGALEQWDSLSMRHISCDVGPGAVNCNATAANRALVGRGCTVLVWRDGKVCQAGVIRVFGEDEGDSNTLKLTWDDPLTYLKSERAWPNPPPREGFTRTDGQGAAVYDSRSGYASSVVLGYVAANVGPGALASRQAPGLVMGDDPKAGVWLDAPVQARYDPLLDLIRGVALPNAVVFSVDVEDRVLVFNARQVEDKSGTVLFSRRLRNVGAGSWTVTQPTATRILVLGPGEGVDQMIFEVPTDEALAAEARWGRAYRDVLTSSQKVADPIAAATAKAAADAEKTAQTALDAALNDQTPIVQAAQDADRALAQANSDAAATDPPTAPQLAAIATARTALVTAIAAQNNAQTAVAAATTQHQAAVDYAAATTAAIDAADWAETGRSLVAEAQRKLSESGETISIEYQAGDSPFELGQDFQLGDLVSVQPDGWDEPVVRPVREWVESCSVSAGRKVNVVIGDYQATSGSSAAIKSRDLLAKVRRLQVR